MKPAAKLDANDYVIRVLQAPDEVDAAAWDALLACQEQATPFMRHAYLQALHASGCATPATGWTPCFITLEHGSVLVAGCPLYLKTHSRGEYVFDQGWAQAYARNGLAYYPKALAAVPFTPVPGARLLARSAADRSALLHAVLQWCQAQKLSSLHLLFAGAEDLQACTEAGLLLRHTVQFHWTNMAPTLVAARAALPPEGAVPCLGRPGAAAAPTLATACAALPPEGAVPCLGRPGAAAAPALVGGFRDFDDFLAALSQDKRKKIRQERRKVAQAGVTFRWALGVNIAEADWDFFYRCYQRTYLEHGNAPYLSRDFFARMAKTMLEHWLLFVAQREGRPIATSLIAVDARATGSVAYGRYWGALERVDCLHFEACYYQPLQWCIEHGYRRFEGGAQGEHKMARALLPVQASSAHWLAEPAFASAIDSYLQREAQAVGDYLADLGQHSPLRGGA